MDFDRVLKLRLVVARHGEMDGARWWNTQGQLGKYGALALRRGFPRTYPFAQARSVFAVAAHRCAQLFDPPNCITLWRLPEPIEEELEVRWERWIDQSADWQPFFEKLAGCGAGDLGAALSELGGLTRTELDHYPRLRRSSEAPAILLPNVFAGTDEDVALLALGFARGEVGAPVVPYARLA
jgi:hypothetical protein